MTDLATGALLEAAHAQQADAVDLRRSIHADPELGLDNPRTQAKIVDALDGLGLEIRTGDACTSVIADLVGAADGPTVLLRADTDALPMTEDTAEDFRSTTDGRAHACGHDAHVAMLVGAARVLSERRRDIAGTVRFMFQPGEEGGGGAAVMINEGVLEGVDRAFAIHITPNIPMGLVSSRPGPLMASADTFSITMRGEGGHASTPHFCTDPIPPACAIVPALQLLVTREIDAFNPGLITVGHIDAGTTTNVIPETAFLEGTIRTVSESTRATLHLGVERIARSIAQAHKCSADVEIGEGYPVTVNHGSEVDRVNGMVDAALGEGRYFELPTPVMGAEDFSYITQQVPGAMALLGVCPDDIEDSLTAPPCHSNRMRLNEDALASGIALHCAMALAGAG